MSATAHEFLCEAEGLLRPVGHGLLYDEDGRADDNARASALSLASHYLRLAAISLLRDPSAPAQARLDQLRAEHIRLSASDRVDTAGLRTSLTDWTEPLRRPAGQLGDFDLEHALAEAAARPERNGAVLSAGRAALEAGWPGEKERRDAAAALDAMLRTAAVRGDTFQLIAASVVAGVTGEGVLADAIAAALTTKAFRSAADRSGLRIMYASLALLAHPHVTDRDYAIEASGYLLRRERPGPDELEFLGAAAMQTRRDPDAVLGLIAQWLAWRDHGPDNDDLPHVARNVCCSLDLACFAPLETVLHRIANEPSGERLIRHLTAGKNEALVLGLRNSNSRKRSAQPWPFRVSPQKRVTEVTRHAPGGGPPDPGRPIIIELPAETAATCIIGEECEQLPSPDARFTKFMRRGARDQAAA